jgi:hypothetical protein
MLAMKQFLMVTIRGWKRDVLDVGASSLELCANTCIELKTLDDLI